MSRYTDPKAAGCLLEVERQEWKLDAMTPAQRAAEFKRRKDAGKAWKEKLLQIRESLAAGKER